MTVTISDELVQSSRLSQAEILQTLAVALFAEEKLTLAQAARLAGIDRLRFQHLLASRRIPLHYDVADYEEDLRTIATLPAR